VDSEFDRIRVVNCQLRGFDHSIYQFCLMTFSITDRWLQSPGERLSSQYHRTSLGWVIRNLTRPASLAEINTYKTTHVIQEADAAHLPLSSPLPPLVNQLLVNVLVNETHTLTIVDVWAHNRLEAAAWSNKCWLKHEAEGSLCVIRVS